jgi:predicted RNase H-like HicB family nuclease
MQPSIESVCGEDGLWLADVPQLPGVLAYGVDRNEAAAKARRV